MAPFLLQGPIPGPPACTVPVGEHKEQEFLPLTLAYGLSPESSFQKCPFGLSFIAASSSALSIQPKRQKWNPPPQGGLADHPGIIPWDESSHSLALYLPSNIHFPPATNTTVVLFCLNTLQSTNSLIPTGQQKALFYDSKHWDFA